MIRSLTDVEILLYLVSGDRSHPIDAVLEYDTGNHGSGIKPRGHDFLQMYLESQRVITDTGTLEIPCML
jgi:hypothetical protein